MVAFGAMYGIHTLLAGRPRLGSNQALHKSSTLYLAHNEQHLPRLSSQIYTDLDDYQCYVVIAMIHHSSKQESSSATACLLLSSAAFVIDIAGTCLETLTQPRLGAWSDCSTYRRLHRTFTYKRDGCAFVCHVIAQRSPQPHHFTP